MKEFYTVGEFSKLFGINLQTLHYYDKIGLLCPQKRSPDNQWRYYAFDQVYKLASIRFMRRVGYNIEQIKQFLNNSDVNASLDSLRVRSQEMKAKWQEIMTIDEVIQRKIQFIEQRIRTINVRESRIRWFPERRYIPIGTEEMLYHFDAFYFYPTIVFYQGESKLFGAYLDASFNGLDVNAKDGKPTLETEVIPAGLFICAYHVGPYNELKETYHNILKEYPDTKVEFERHVNFNIIDQFVESDSSKYITEIQIPLSQ